MKPGRKNRFKDHFGLYEEEKIPNSRKDIESASISLREEDKETEESLQELSGYFREPRNGRNRRLYHARTDLNENEMTRIMPNQSSMLLLNTSSGAD